jgi:hypothetical protein
MGQLAAEEGEEKDPAAQAQFAAKRKNHYNEFEMMRRYVQPQASLRCAQRGSQLRCGRVSVCRAREMMDEEDD